MEFIGKVCPYCKSTFEAEDEVVLCSVCEMPHHKDCWVENGGCTTFGCTGTIMGTGDGVTQNAESEAAQGPAAAAAQVLSAEPEGAARFCVQCGTAFQEGQKFCTRCGATINHTTAPAITSAGTWQQQVSPNYEADVKAFVQENVDRYLPIFVRMKQGGSQVSWNWCGCLLALYWFAYRKMYVHAVVYVVIATLVPIPLVVPICGGLFADTLYKSFVDSHLQRANRLGSMEKAEYLAKKGGTSAIALVIVIVVPIVLVVLASIGSYYSYY